MRLFALFSKTLLALLATATALCAQDGKVANRYAAPDEGEEWYSVNDEAWESFESFDMVRYFGEWDQQAFILDVDYESETVIWGTKTAQQSVRPRFQWLGPLFGGDGYTSVEGIIPFDSQYTQQLWIYGGWKYHLTPDVDIDIGGNIVLATNNNYGPGIPVPSGTGWTQRGTVYMGFIGRMFLHPSAYLVYDFSLDQKTLLLGIQQEWDLHEEFGAPEGLALDFQTRFGWLSANSWLGKGRTTTGNQWRNGYIYTTSRLDIIYRLENGISMYVGPRHAWNNDGTGPVGINGFEMGPEEMFWWGAGVSYEF